MTRPRVTRRSLVLRGLASLAVFAFAVVGLQGSTCSSVSDKVNGPSDISGTYTLRTVDGSSVPFTLPSNAYVTSINSGQLAINSAQDSAMVTLNVTTPDGAGGTATSTQSATLGLTRNARQLTLSGSFGGYTGSLVAALNADNNIQIAYPIAGTAHTMIFAK